MFQSHFEKAYIIGPRLAASTSEVIFICSPAGHFLITSAICLLLYNCLLFVSLPSPIGERFHSFCAALQEIV